MPPSGKHESVLGIPARLAHHLPLPSAHGQRSRSQAILGESFSDLLEKAARQSGRQTIRLRHRFNRKAGRMSSLFGQLKHFSFDVPETVPTAWEPRLAGSGGCPTKPTPYPSRPRPRRGTGRWPSMSPFHKTVSDKSLRQARLLAVSESLPSQGTSGVSEPAIAIRDDGRPAAKPRPENQDSPWAKPPDALSGAGPPYPNPIAPTIKRAEPPAETGRLGLDTDTRAVSYTHLTLPTIYSV